jgi:hypothetical protein
MAWKVENYEFNKWTGIAPPNTYGGKPLINWGGKGLFAELTVLEMFRKEGWDGVWIDSYGKCYRNDMPGLADPIVLPDDRKKFIEMISDNAPFASGCWDLFLWKNEDILFVELKRKGKDSIRPPQIDFYKKAIAKCLKDENFLMIEWSYE